MTVAPTLDELRDRVARMQGRPAAQPVATHRVLSGLLQLQSGSSYAVDAPSLAMVLMAGPSAEGAWCAVVGWEGFGLEAAVATGVDLRRTILVPDPGEAWLEVTAALTDVVGVVVVVPPTSVSAKDAGRISARLRRRGSILMVWGSWPRCDARLRMRDVEWIGVGRGHGHLQARQVTVEVSRGTAPPRAARWWLPGPDLAVRRVEEQPVVLRSVG